MSTFEELKASGNEHFKRKDYLAAIADYTKAIIAAPQEVALYSNRAACYLALKQWDDAIADSRKAAEVDRTFIKGYVRGAKAYTAKGSFGQAASMLAGAIAVAPDSTEVPILQVECLLGKRDYDGAFTMVTALMRKGTSLKLVYLRGKALFYQGEIDKAEKHLAEAVRGDPENAEFIKLLRLIKKMLRAKQEGNDAFKRGDNDAAVEAYTAAMAIEPANTKFAAVLLSNRAAAHMNARRYEAVIVDCGKAIDLDAENPKTYLRRARAAMELGGKDHIEQAIRDYNATKDLVGPGQQRDIKRDLQKAQAALKQAKRKDYYKILNVPRGADDREIKAAFRKGALKWHPDRHVTKSDEEKHKAAEMFKDVNEANTVLSDPKKRQRYDNGVDIEHLDEEDRGMGGMGGMGGGIDPSVFFSMFGGGGGMGGMGGGMPRGFRFG